MGIYRDLLLWLRRIRDNHAHVIITLGTSAVEVFEHGWRDSLSHPLRCQGEILEDIRGVRGHGSGERTGEDGGLSEGASASTSGASSYSNLRGEQARSAHCGKENEMKKLIMISLFLVTLAGTAHAVVLHLMRRKPD